MPVDVRSSLPSGAEIEIDYDEPLGPEDPNPRPLNNVKVKAGTRPVEVIMQRQGGGGQRIDWLHQTVQPGQEIDKAPGGPVQNLEDIVWMAFREL